MPIADLAVAAARGGGRRPPRRRLWPPRGPGDGRPPRARRRRPARLPARLLERRPGQRRLRGAAGRARGPRARASPLRAGHPLRERLRLLPAPGAARASGRLLHARSRARLRLLLPAQPALLRRLASGATRRRSRRSTSRTSPSTRACMSRAWCRAPGSAGRGSSSTASRRGPRRARHALLPHGNASSASRSRAARAGAPLLRGLERPGHGRAAGPFWVYGAGTLRLTVCAIAETPATLWVDGEFVDRTSRRTGRPVRRPSWRDPAGTRSSSRCRSSSRPSRPRGSS